MQDKTLKAKDLKFRRIIIYRMQIKKMYDKKRGWHQNRPRKMSIETEESITNTSNCFPMLSHYVRKDSTKKYLSELLIISKMYLLYRTWFEEQQFDCLMATKRQYETIFNTMFNFSFLNLRKTNAVNVLVTWLRNTRNFARKYDKHKKNKADPSETTVAFFDLGKVLSIPRSEVG